jgi:S-DNA-T family DNA segregation ATPase FtsK/SpoIIIE
MFRRKRKAEQAYDGLRPHVAAWERGLYQTLTRNDIGYNVTDKTRGPQVFTFRLRLADSANLSKALSLDEQLALTMGVQWVALGQTATGTPVHVNLAGNRTCHALVSGMTGSGKTVTEQLIAWTLATDNDPHNVNLLLLDGKGGTAWWGFEREAHLAHPVIGDPREATAALTWCVMELDKRKRDQRRLPRLFVVVDEIRELLDVGGEPVAEAVRRIAALGRELGVHVILATQHPLVDALGGSIAKANLPLRLTGRVADANAAYVATGVKCTGAETLQGNGDFLLTVAGEVHRLQIAMVGNRELGRLPRVETTPRLDFGDYDPVRVLDVTPKVKADPIEPEHVAVALATGRGITWLVKELGIGSNKARRVKDFAQTVHAKLQELDYTITPAYQEGYTEAD